MSHSRLLRQKIQLAGLPLAAANRAFWEHPDLAALIPELFFRIHGMIRASVPLMEAARRVAAGRDGDPSAAGLVAYLDRHIPEERHHDEWLLDDLECLGWDRDATLRRPPSPTVAAIVGAQYYWIHHHHPVALLGYIAILEGHPPTGERIEATIASTGLPREAFRTYAKHAHLDPRHRDDLDRALDALPLAEEHVALIGLNAVWTTQQLGRIYTELLDLFEEKRSAAVA